jgi:hypothetical protein
MLENNTLGNVDTMTLLNYVKIITMRKCVANFHSKLERDICKHIKILYWLHKIAQNNNSKGGGGLEGVYTIMTLVGICISKYFKVHRAPNKQYLLFMSYASSGVY